MGKSKKKNIKKDMKDVNKKKVLFIFLVCIGAFLILAGGTTAIDHWFIR